MSVGPPSAQWTMWWPSHQPGGRSQPGNTQPAVSQGERSPLGGGDGSGGSADVDRFAASAEHDGDDAGVAREAPRGLGRDRFAGVVDVRRSRWPSARSSRRIVTVMVGRPGSAPTARRITSASAAARRCAAVRVGPPEAFSARQSRSYSASTAALITAPSSLAYTPSKTVVPSNVDDTCSRSPSPRSRCSRSGSAANSQCRNIIAVWSTVSRQACSTSTASSRANTSIVLSLRCAADASSVAFANDSSPSASAASVPGIDRNRRAVRTIVAADDRLSSHRYANHAAPEVAPS